MEDYYLEIFNVTYMCIVKYINHSITSQSDIQDVKESRNSEGYLQKGVAAKSISWVVETQATFYKSFHVSTIYL